jgi:hypothetical protein
MISTTLSYGDYAALPGLRWSTLRHIGDSPRHCRHAEQHPRDTSELTFLRSVHEAVLEQRMGHVVYDGIRRGKQYELFEACHPGRVILSPREDARLQGVVQAVRGHAAAARLLSDGSPEVSVTWADYKARIDWLGPDYIVDLKTLGTTDTGAIARQSAIREYHGQLAHYVDGLRSHGREIRRAYLIVCEGDGAQDVAVLDVDDRALDVGLALRDRYAETYRECVRTGIWPGRHPEIVPIGLPEWAVPQADEVNDG